MSLLSRTSALATLSLGALLALGACSDGVPLSTAPEVSRRGNGLGDDPVTVRKGIIKAEFGAYIPKSKGAPIRINDYDLGVTWDFPLSEPYASLGWSEEPHNPLQHPPGTGAWIFATDNRELPGEKGDSGTSRLYSVGAIAYDEIGYLSNRRQFLFETKSDLSYQAQGTFRTVGQTHLINAQSRTIVGRKPSPSDVQTVFDDRPGWTSTATVRASGKHPFSFPQAFVPSIDYTAALTLTKLPNGDVRGWYTVTHDAFPNYELLIMDRVIYSYAAPDPGPTLHNLHEPGFYFGEPRISRFGPFYITAAELNGQVGGGTPPGNPPGGTPPSGPAR